MRIINGEGPKEAKVFIVGEAPGAKEEEEGRPFVGRSGKLLEEALHNAGIERHNVYITNLVKFRPPKNRDPLAHEVKSYKNLLEKELELIKPEVVITLGRHSGEALLGKALKITRDRGHVYPTLKKYKVLPTFHPAYVNRNPSSKEDFLEDILYGVKKAYEKGR